MINSHKRLSSKAKSFPKLMRYIGNTAESFIVLFTSETTGVVVYTNEDTRPIGLYCTYWHYSSFVEESDDVILSNL